MSLTEKTFTSFESMQPHLLIVKETINAYFIHYDFSLDRFCSL